MRYYPATIERLEEDGKTYYLGQLRFAENYTAFAQGDTEAEAIADLESNIIGAVEFAMKEDEPFPKPRPFEQGEIAVLMPTLVEAKVLLHNERLKRQLSKTDLGKLAGFSPAEMQRLLNPWYKSGIDKLDQLFKALGLTPSFKI
ncbi:type II toxin-antitoxin system HicB family antitoxin [Mannheimia pernigra]|uniref:type II toxin-antitoxin system HicB family antitoxin n=1 Tax=Mannheimia pernigra TaxID=111844 RepID=UPI00159F4102|nr:type II toxin-antitoxin system HicB family antitoxin [Mannheimia pernigra]QLB44708.1 type II toxin-antitoxin system HicB family antitoxin [Mannheimia pernigra]